MKLHLEKMLDRVEKGHWDVNDFDWSQKSKLNLSRADEIRVCQHFLNLSYIERMAAALFLSLSERMEDPTVKAIYKNFHKDEIRHAQAMARLQDYFDVHAYKTYLPSKAMMAFFPYFVSSLDTMNPAFANSAVTIGELFLDIALLRALNDYVEDPLSRAVIEKVNQDESRHVTMDFYMSEYCSDHIMKPKKKSRLPALFNRDLWGTTIWGQGFGFDVFLKPMSYLDKGNVRQKEALMRLRRLYAKPELAKNPAVKQFNEMIASLESPRGRKIAETIRRAVKAGTGVDLGFMSIVAKENMSKGSGDTAAHPKSAVEMAAEIFEA